MAWRTPALVSNGLIANSVTLVGGAPIDFVSLPLHYGVTLLYGPNGSGKTTVLDGVASAVSGVRRRSGEARLICNLTAEFSGFDSGPLLGLIELAAAVTGADLDEVFFASTSLRGESSEEFDAFDERAHVVLVDWLRTQMTSIARGVLGDAAVGRDIECSVTLLAAGTPDEPGWDAYVSALETFPRQEAIPDTLRGFDLGSLRDHLIAHDRLQLLIAGRESGHVRLRWLGRLSAAGAVRSARADDEFDVEAATLAYVRARYHTEVFDDPWEAADALGATISGSATTFLQQLAGADYSLRYDVHRPSDWIENGLGTWALEEAPGRWAPVTRLGSGWRRWAALAIRFSLSDIEAPAVVLIDEPEAGLHPLAIRSITQALSAFEENSVLMTTAGEEQIGCVIATTHHPAVLGAKGAQLYAVDKTAEGTTVLATVDLAGTPDEIAQTVGCSMPEILLMTQFFIFVEGVHDKAVIETVFADELAERRARVVVMGGASNIGHHINAEFFTKYTSARLVVVLDRIGKVAGDLWDEARSASAAGDLDRAHRALNEIGRRAGREADWLADAGRTALDLGTIDRITVIGLEKPDIVLYLPVEELVPGASSWEALGAPPRGKDFKDWLREAHRAQVHLDRVRAAATKLDNLHDLPAILAALR